MSENNRMDTAKSIARLIVGGLVEMFVGAATNSIVDNVDGSKWAKWGAKAGGFLVGMMIADRVGDYVCDSMDETMEELEKLKEAVEEEEE